MANVTINPHKLIIPEPGQRVFFSGDVHGDQVALKKKLSQVGFVEREDMLIFTGDLIDRGNYSAALIEFATSTPYVHSVIGNHESLFLHGIHDPLCRHIHTSSKVGGQWIEQYSQQELEDLAELIISTMSIAITVETGCHKIGVIHAAAPNDWQSVLKSEAVDEEEWLWNRKQFEEAVAGKQHWVNGLDAVIHGHVVNYKTVSGNHIWIDTLYHTGSLTIIEASSVLGSISNQTEHVDPVIKGKRIDVLDELSELDQKLDLGY
jgi:predicted MPP superfamily phosphohydrolase